MHRVQDDGGRSVDVLREQDEDLGLAGDDEVVARGRRPQPPFFVEDSLDEVLDVLDGAAGADPLDGGGDPEPDEGVAGSLPMMSPSIVMIASSLSTARFSDS